MRIRDNYWIIFEENYVQKDLEKQEIQVNKWWQNKQRWGCEHISLQLFETSELFLG